MDAMLRCCKDKNSVDLGYRKISFEYIADEWAVNFINNYPEVLSIDDKIITQ